MNNELIGVIETDASLVGEVTDSQLEINVSVIEAGPRGLPGPPGPPGTANYNDLTNKPRIESVELIGNKTFEDLGIDNINKVEISNIF